MCGAIDISGFNASWISPCGYGKPGYTTGDTEEFTDRISNKIQHIKYVPVAGIIFLLLYVFILVELLMVILLNYSWQELTYSVLAT